ncbi:MAG: type IV pilus modification PilV family protein [Desulfobulbaceae bacterium]|jgi:general secretion pathway protein I
MRKTTKEGGQNGFTFLEVMVAVAILAIAFVTLIGSQSQSVSVAGDSRFRVMSALLAQQKLAELEAVDFEEVIGGEGDFGDDYPGYTWQAEVRDLGEDDTGIKEGDDLLKAVDLLISQGESRTYGVSVLVMRRPEKK